jgi:hypothetical protein
LCLQGLVKEAIDAADRRVRIIRITEKGRRRSEQAMPFSRQAQVARAMGEEAIAALNGLLDQSTASSMVFPAARLRSHRGRALVFMTAAVTASRHLHSSPDNARG